MDLGLADRVVLITGGSRGIGRATALAFAGEGARVALTYRTASEQAQKVVAEIVGMGGEALAVRLDLSEPDSISAAIEAVRRRWDGIDVFVANAVRFPDTAPGASPAFEDVPPEQWRAVLRGSLEGTIACIQAVLPAMRARGDGRIVLISSDLARRVALPGTGIYGAAKAALAGLMNGLVAELRGDILVNIVTPGLTMTERNLEQIPQSLRDVAIAHTPTGRLSQPEDVARAILFLGSPANVNITGDNVSVTGGL